MRKSGILLPVFSLPGDYAIGCFSKDAYRFIDFLKGAEQSYWQILPIGPTVYGNSPYQAVSAFAINPYYIDPDKLVEEGLLRREECDILKPKTEWNRVDYDSLHDNYIPTLMLAYKRFIEQGDYTEFDSFCEKEAYWLEPYSKYMQKKEKDFPNAGFFSFLQFKAYKQWFALKAYANKNGIKIIGDLPIYIAPDGVDVISEPELFILDKDNKPIEVAGCPPDGYAPKGQLWGNPLYDWEYHKQTDYSWWKKRMKNALMLFDVVRIDHFRGFDAYYSIPAKDKDASGGKWNKGPGIELFESLKNELGELNVIAEDLGFLTPSVKALLKNSGFPGMKVLQFAFSGDEKNEYLPHRYKENSVVYTGTHDNNTTLGWLNAMSKHEKKIIYDYFDITDEIRDEDLTDYIVALAMVSKAQTCIIPIQDYIQLGSDSRINIPSTVGGNWIWRVEAPELTEGLKCYIKDLTIESQRSK